MALIECPECQGRVSDRAPACPQCGAPTAASAGAATVSSTQSTTPATLQATTPAVPASGLAAASAATPPRAAGAPGGPLASAAGMVAPAGAVVPPHRQEETLWQGTPSLKALLTRIVSTALSVVLVPLMVYAAYPRILEVVADMSKDMRQSVAAHREQLSTAVVLGVVLLLGIRVGRMAWQVATLKAQRYRLTNQRLVIESGVLSRRIEEIDMRTVEDLAFEQTLLERLLGIGTVVVVASDRTAGRYSLRGLAEPRETRELIRNAAYQATHTQLFTRQT